MDGNNLIYVDDKAIYVEFEEEMSHPDNRKVNALDQALSDCRIPGVGQLLLS